MKNPLMMKQDESEGTKVYGYVRISTPKQNFETQRLQLQKVGCDKIFCDMGSGRKFNHKEFEAMMKITKPGDRIVVTQVSRLGRRALDLLKFRDYIKDHGIFLSVLDYNLDTSTAMGDMNFLMYIFQAELEWCQRVERTYFGIQRARYKNQPLGRKKKLKSSQVNNLVTLYEKKEFSLRELSEMFNISIPSIYTYIRKKHLNPV